MKRKLIFSIVILSILLIFAACYYNPAPLKYDLIVEIQGQGNILPAGGVFQTGRIIVFDILPKSGWVFSHWSGRDSGELLKISGQWQLTINREIKLTAIFIEDDTEGKRDLDVTVVGSGTVYPTTGRFEEDETIIFNIQAQAGWIFSHWEGANANDVVYDGNFWTLKMNENKVLSAVFKRSTYNLSVSVIGSGTVVKTSINEVDSAKYLNVSRLLLTAKPDPGWDFQEWSGDLHGTEPFAEIVMDSDKNVLATFVEKQFNLAITVVGKGKVEEKLMYDGALDYPYGSVVRLWAKADPGWSFKEWRGDETGSDEVLFVDMGKDKIITAIFEELEKELEIKIIGQGRVEERLMGGTTQNTYPPGSLVRLWAKPAEGWVFKEWRNDAEGSNPLIQIEMDEDKKVTAVFIEEESPGYCLFLEINGSGRVTKNPDYEDYEPASKVTLIAKADNGWVFNRWRGDLSGSDAQAQITMDDDKYITAVFTRQEEERYHLHLDIKGNGRVTKDPDYEDYEAFTLVNLLAQADSGWEFSGWQGDVSGSSGQVQIRMDGHKEVTANFIPKQESRYRLNINLTGSGQVTKNPDLEDYAPKTTVTLTATASAGWVFKGWQGDVSGSNSQVQILMDRDKDVTALFAYNSGGGGYKLDAAAAYSNQGSVELNPPGGQYPAGTIVTATAIPADGFLFAYWRDPDLRTITQRIIDITMDCDKKYRVYFWVDSG